MLHFMLFRPLRLIQGGLRLGVPGAACAALLAILLYATYDAGRSAGFQDAAGILELGRNPPGMVCR